MADSDFADLLLSDPDEALSGYELTAEEVAALKEMALNEIAEQRKHLLEPRKSWGTPFGDSASTAYIHPD
jgi:hypothetical protein